jgi:hypothetical protein
MRQQTDVLTRLLGQQQRRPALIDIKGLGRPKVYTGVEAEWMEWHLKVNNFVSATFPEAKSALELCGEHEQQLTEDQLDLLFGDPDSQDHLAEWQPLGLSLMTVLVSLTSGEPLDIVRGCTNGWEAWRRLTRRYDPTTGGRRRNLLQAILKPERASMDTLSHKLEQWEELVRQYERRRDANGDKKVLDDDIKCSVLEDLVPQELATHLRMNRSRLGTYDLMRSELMLFCEIRTGNKIKPRSGASASGGKGGGDDPMDVDSFQQKGGKGAAGKGGKGKGKAGKGKGKGHNNKGSNSNNPSSHQRSDKPPAKQLIPRRVQQLWAMGTPSKGVLACRRRTGERRPEAQGQRQGQGCRRSGAGPRSCRRS